MSVMEYRELDRNQRVFGTDKKVERVVSSMVDYDLSSLIDWCGPGVYKFGNLGGTEIDFAGADISMDVFLDNQFVRRWLLQDKWRASGNDLGLEFARIYEYEWTDGRPKQLILDAGRDLYRIPTVPIVTRNGKFAERDWRETSTISDFFLFHNRDPKSPRTFIDSKYAKAIGKKLFISVRKIWNDLATDFQDRVFNRSKTIVLKNELGTDYFVTALREPTNAKGSTKAVLNYDLETNQAISDVHCWIAKIIVYIPLEIFNVQEKIKYCPRRSS